MSAEFGLAFYEYQDDLRFYNHDKFKNTSTFTAWYNSLEDILLCCQICPSPVQNVIIYDKSIPLSIQGFYSY